MDMRAAFYETLRLAEARGMGSGGVSALGLDDLNDMRARITPQFSDAKLGRWLGWAQCAVTVASCATLDEMKEIDFRHARKPYDR